MELKKGTLYSFEKLIQSLLDYGYQRLPIVLSPETFLSVETLLICLL